VVLDNSGLFPTAGGLRAKGVGILPFGMEAGRLFIIVYPAVVLLTNSGDLSILQPTSNGSAAESSSLKRWEAALR
jgi:hypothetical protein